MAKVVPPQSTRSGPSHHHPAPIASGSFEGPLLRGTVLPGGCDWTLLRSDGVLELDLRLTLQTDDGAPIFLSSFGLRHGPPDVLTALARGEAVDPSKYYFRTAARFETSAAQYAFFVPAYCVMPDHLHALAMAAAESSNLIKFVEAFKQETAIEFERRRSRRLCAHPGIRPSPIGSAPKRSDLAGILLRAFGDQAEAVDAHLDRHDFTALQAVPALDRVDLPTEGVELFTVARLHK